jgi:mannose-1-phosphate guanylyltransferase
MMFYAVVMAGGSGTRFWPLSRRAEPKQLLAIVSEKLLVQEALDRLEGLVPLERTFIVTGKDQLPKMRDCLPQMPEDQLLVEPQGRNTAAAIGLAAVILERIDPNAVMAFLPSDHLIRPKKGFQKVLAKAAELAQTVDCLVTIGIPPTEPARGYGYIQRGEETAEVADVRCFKVRRFVEKPDPTAARQFLRTGEYYWNSGIFVWRLPIILRHLERYAPDLYEGLRRIQAALDTLREAKTIGEEYARFEPISIDYAVMEKARDVRVIEAEFEWDDIGSWLAVERHHTQDEQGNTVVGRHVGIETEKCIVLTGPQHLVATIAVEGLIIVQTADATLVARKTEAQRVQELVELIKERGLEEYL